LNSQDQTANLEGIFAESKAASTYQVTTGWAADNLLIINTKNADGSQGPSYWLGVPDLSLTVLSTKF
ncbi:MAG TPA: hypothetical protein VG935_04110, partial [Patescibacteria group bacterium]|nr:hypothetical protein [Patescibacteria group bacterium]